MARTLEDVRRWIRYDTHVGQETWGDAQIDYHWRATLEEFMLRVPCNRRVLVKDLAEDQVEVVFSEDDFISGTQFDRMILVDESDAEQTEEYTLESVTREDMAVSRFKVGEKGRPILLSWTGHRRAFIRPIPDHDDYELHLVYRSGAPDFIEGTQGPYSGTKTYSCGDVVLSVDAVYRSKVNSNTGNTPATSPAQWELIPGLTTLVAPSDVTFGEVPEQFVRQIVKYGLKAELLDGFPGMELAFTTARNNYERLIREANTHMHPPRQTNMNPQLYRDNNRGEANYDHLH